MCCDAPEDDLLPPPIAAMLDTYRALRSERPADWGDETGADAEQHAYARWLGAALLFTPPDLAAGTWPELVREHLPEPLPAGLVVATADAGGVTPRAGPTPYLIGASLEVAVLLDSRLDRPTRVEVGGSPVPLGAGGVELVTLTVTGADPVPIAGTAVTLVERVAAARLRLRAGAPSRWSVVDDRGGAWFPDGLLPKWDYHGRPLFHGDDLEVAVPAVPLTVTCARGVEFGTAEAAPVPAAGEAIVVELAPERLYETAARGWYGGDLHVHMNYSGDLVAGPHDAARMQLGEGLHLMNLVAGNARGARIYDREAFEHTAGEDLPWTTAERVARFGVEYRNDLLGHVHALGPTGPPARYCTGHAGSDDPVDWPPNSDACAELRDLGATIGYAHPLFSPLRDGSPAEAFKRPRSVEARELVADAALGLVDSVDLIGLHDYEGSTVLYHHLLNCGLRLAATVGTDVWLSFSRGGIVSNPPGWARVYADLRGAPLSVAAFQAAVRAGRTMTTNGPWLQLSVGGHGPGDTVEATAGRTVPVSVRTEGIGVEHVELVGPDGILARAGTGGGDGTAAIDTEVRVDGSMWLCAVARGPGHPAVLDDKVFAHTSPAYVLVGGAPVSRAASARWLLDWLDRFEALVTTEGRFTDPAQRDEVVAVIERARPFYRAQVR